MKEEVIQYEMYTMKHSRVVFPMCQQLVEEEVGRRSTDHTFQNPTGDMVISIGGVRTKVI